MVVWFSILGMRRNYSHFLFRKGYSHFDNIFNQGNNRFKLKPVYTVGERNKVDNLNIC